MASALHKHGYRKGDVFFTLTVNLPEFTILTLATSCLGIIVSPGNPMSTSGCFFIVANIVCIVCKLLLFINYFFS